jgi:hypothetical protein
VVEKAKRTLWAAFAENDGGEQAWPVDGLQNIHNRFESKRAGG